MAPKTEAAQAKPRATKSNEKKPDVVGMKSRSSRQMEYGPMLTLLFFSTAMLVLPLSTYFCIRKYLFDSTTYGAMGAVVMVQIIVAAYIYKAWSDENKEHQQQLKEKAKKK